jgi:dihydropteroate synthase
VLVMGIVNATPDSFSDGGQYFDDSNDPRAAVERGLALIEQGAHIVDVGGESTRPGAPAISIDAELARVLPVIEALAKAGHCVSIDTKKPEVMRQAVAAGAAIVNDVFALQAPGAIEICAQSDVGVVLMHMQGEPGTMQKAPRYNDVVSEVGVFLKARTDACQSAGIAADRLAIDPGFGFGKTLEHNKELTRRLRELVALGFPLVAGWSRKSSLGAITGHASAEDRVSASVAAAIACVSRGARIVRVHDVRETVDVLKVWSAFEDHATG